MEHQFKNLLLETLRTIKDHPDAKHGVGFTTYFDEEPDWEVVIAFQPKQLDTDDEVMH